MSFYVQRKHLGNYEWDYENKSWQRPDIDTAVIKELSKRNSPIGLFRVLTLVLFLSGSAMASVILYGINPFLALIPLYVYFGFYGFRVALAHELQHRTVFAKAFAKPAELLYLFVQTLIWNGPVYARISHRLHHRYTMIREFDPETDWPEIFTTRVVVKFILNTVSQLLVVGAVILLVKDILKLFKRAVGIKDHMMEKFSNEAENKKIRLESAVILMIHGSIIAVAVLLEAWWLLVFVTLAWQIGSAVEGIWHNTEHISKMYDSNHQVLCTRSVKVCKFTKWIYFGLDDHVEHHIYPAVPSCNLGKLHELMKDYQDEPKNVIGCWREILKTASAKDSSPTIEYVPGVIQMELK